MPTYDNKTYLKLMRPLPDYVERDIYDIPVIKPEKIDISMMNNGLWLTNMKNLSAKNGNRQTKIVHSFSYDDVLYREYNNPIRYLEKTSGFYAVSSFDFSMDEHMDFKHILEATYNNRWSGAFMQVNGRRVIPTVGWCLPNTYDICMAGLRDGGLFLISTLGVNNDERYPIFINGYYELRNRFPNTQILCVGDRLEGMDTDVCVVNYKNSFGNWDCYYDFWQPSFVNWNGTIEKGVL